MQQLPAAPHGPALVEGRSPDGSGPTVPTMTVSMPTPTSPAAGPVLDGMGNHSDSDADIEFFPSTQSIFETNARPPMGERTPSRDRLEWHSMLATVLLGEVLNQEKTRLQGGQADSEKRSYNEELWYEIGARAEGRSVRLHTRLIGDRRRSAKGVIDDVIGFRVSEGDGDSDDEPERSASDQIGELMERVDKMWASWPAGKHLAREVSRVQSTEFVKMEGALVAWQNLSEAVQFQVSVLRNLVNDRIDISSEFAEMEEALSEGRPTGSFIEKVLTDPSLATLWRPPHSGIILRLDVLVIKAKDALIQYGYIFEQCHFPSFVEDLLTLINFPTRLVKAVLEFRVRSAGASLVQPSGEGVGETEEAMRDFHSLLDLAAVVKETYSNLMRPQDGWRLPECIEEGYDLAYLDGLRFYFQMLNWRLAAPRNADKETDILDDEWAICGLLGKYVEDGPLEIALQFCLLTGKSLRRLTTFFIEEVSAYSEAANLMTGRRSDRQKQLKTLLNGVRARQRKLFRFARILSERLENTTEYAIGDDETAYQGLADDDADDGDEVVTEAGPAGEDGVGRDIGWILQLLADTGHVLVRFNDDDSDDRSSTNTDRLVDEARVVVLASPELSDQPRKIAALLALVFRTDRSPDGPTYVLALIMPAGMSWPGQAVAVTGSAPRLEIAPGRLWLIANGMERVLIKARLQLNAIVRLRVAVRQRSNSQLINVALRKIKQQISMLSRTIVQSVDVIRRKTAGVPGNDDIVHRSFQFAADFGERSFAHVRGLTRKRASERLMELALDWLDFVCRDCDPSVGRTFRWAVMALEFAARMMKRHLMNMTETAYGMVQRQVAQCMSLLVSHFDIMGARSLEQRRRLAADEREDPLKRLRERMIKLADIDERLHSGRLIGRVLDPNNEADRALALLSSAGGHIGIRWQQGGFLGGGTFGTVYAAKDLDTEHELAVKEIRLNDPLLIPIVIGKIREEVKTLQRLRHQYIVQYYGFEPHRDKVCIFMEYCPGGSLATLLQHGPIQDEMVLQLYTHMMLEGLQYLHGQGIAHRDVKPQNILLSEHGEIKFVDFGTAKSIARSAADLAGKTNDDGLDRRILETLDVGGLLEIAPEVVVAAMEAVERADEERDPDVDADHDGFGLDRLPSEIKKDVSRLMFGADRPEMAGTPVYFPPEAVWAARKSLLGDQADEEENECALADSTPPRAVSPTDVESDLAVPGSDSTPSTSVAAFAASYSGASASAGDIWALGCVIVEMFTGNRPWSELDNEWAILYSLSRGMAPIIPDMSPLAQSFIEQCFEPDPSKRKTATELLNHPWMTEVLADIEEEEQSEDDPGLPPPSDPPADAQQEPAPASEANGSRVDVNPPDQPGGLADVLVDGLSSSAAVENAQVPVPTQLATGGGAELGSTFEVASPTAGVSLAEPTAEKVEVEPLPSPIAVIPDELADQPVRIASPVSMSTRPAGVGSGGYSAGTSSGGVIATVSAPGSSMGSTKTKRSGRRLSFQSSTVSSTAHAAATPSSTGSKRGSIVRHGRSQSQNTQQHAQPHGQHQQHPSQIPARPQLRAHRSDRSDRSSDRKKSGPARQDRETQTQQSQTQVQTYRKDRHRDNRNKENDRASQHHYHHHHRPRTSSDGHGTAGVSLTPRDRDGRRHNSVPTPAQATGHVYASTPQVHGLNYSHGHAFGPVVTQSVAAFGSHPTSTFPVQPHFGMAGNHGRSAVHGHTSNGGYYFNYPHAPPHQHQHHQHHQHHQPVVHPFSPPQMYFSPPMSVPFSAGPTATTTTAGMANPSGWRNNPTATSPGGLAIMGDAIPAGHVSGDGRRREDERGMSDSTAQTYEFANPVPGVG